MMAKHNIAWLTLLLITMAWRPAEGQTHSLDSTRSVIERTTDSEKKLDALHQLFNKVLDRNVMRALRDARTGLQIARQIDSKTGEVMFLTDLALAEFSRGEIAMSHELYRDALKISDDIDSRDYPITTLTYLSTFYRSTGDLDSAQYFIDAAATLYDRASLNAKLLFHQSKGWLAFQRSQFREAIRQARLKISLNSGFDVSAYPLLSRSHLKLEQYDSATAALKQAFGYYRNDKDSLSSRYYIALLINRGDICMETSKYSSALANYEKAFAHSGLLDFRLYRASAGFKLGYFFETVGNYSQAIELYEEAIQVYEAYQAAQEVARINSRIAWALIYSDNMQLADNFAHRALSQMKKVADQVGVAFAWNILGYLKASQGNYDDALQYYDSALQVRSVQDSQAEYYKSLSNIAEVYLRKGDFEKALAQMKIVLDQEEKNSRDINNLVFTYNSIGSIYDKIGNDELSELNFIKAYEASKENQLYPQLKISLTNLLNLYRERKDGSSVLKYYGELVSVNYTLQKMEQNNKVLQVSALRELEANQREVEELRSMARIEAINAAKKSQELTFYSYLIALLLLIILLVAYIAYSRLKNQKLLSKINKQLEAKVLERTVQLKEAYAELETYFYKASHDLRGPITTLLGLIELSKSSSDPGEKKKIDLLIEDTGKRQLKLVNKIQSLNEVLKSDNQEQDVNLGEEIERILQEQKNALVERNIEVSVDLKVKQVPGSATLLTTILANLIDNSITYCNKINPRIDIRSRKTANSIILAIIDNGEGIQKNISDNLYKMFFRGSVQSSGSGLGLYIVKKAAVRMGATVSFESEPFQRTVFKLELPR